MSFGSEIAGECARQSLRFLLVVMTAVLIGGAVGGFFLKSSFARPYELTADDIDLLKDAAAYIGPGDQIARQLWRLAERAEGK
jgi:uncharacterized protein (UPF0333 family)